MNKELKPCQCGIDIDRTFRVQELWKSYGRYVVGIAYCDNCKEAAPFRSEYRDIEEFQNDAIKAWNTRDDEVAQNCGSMGNCNE